MSDAPYAYQRWVCSTCDGEPVSERNDAADLRCETCGHLFRSGMGGYATYVPDENDEGPIIDWRDELPEDGGVESPEPTPMGDNWCNCQAIRGTANYPGPWHPQGDPDGCLKHGVSAAESEGGEPR